MFQAFFLLLILSTFSVHLSLLDAIQSFHNRCNTFSGYFKEKIKLFRP